MSTPIKISLLSESSREHFPARKITAADASGLGSNTDWSVETYTLQSGLSTGVQVIEVNNGSLAYSILPTRGMGIWKGQWGAIKLGWDSPVKQPVNPAFINLQDRGGLGWLEGFNEWIVRCGLNSMGAPGIDTVPDNTNNPTDVPLTLHGKIANKPAHRVEVEVSEAGISVTGEVDEVTMFGPALRLSTTIRTAFSSNQMVIEDRVSNLGSNPVEYELLYHVNHGEPLLEEGSRLLLPFKRMAPRDPRAAEGVGHYERYGPAEVGFVEQAYFYEPVGDAKNNTLAMLCNQVSDSACLLRFSLNEMPYFTQWKNTCAKKDGLATGLEPCTALPNARKLEREKGRVKVLDANEADTITLSVEVLSNAESVKAAEQEIAQLQSSVEPKIHPLPISDFSG